MHYIYKITNMLNGKIYIGQSKDDKHRWRQHLYFAKHPEKTGQYIHRAMAKYGAENFIFEVIDCALNQWQADCIETCLIQEYDSRNKESGYNIKPGGGAQGGPDNPMFGKKRPMSEETKKKISASNKGQVPWSKGKTGVYSEETIATMNASKKGVPLTEEHKQKLSEAHLGKKQTAEHKQAISNALKSYIRTEEHKQALALARKGKPGPCSGKTWELIDGKRVYSDKKEED
jgi:group I intron endonuclease